MAVLRLKGVDKGVQELQCLSTDKTDLPMDVATGSTCFVADTFEALVFHGEHWYDGSTVVK